MPEMNQKIRRSPRLPFIAVAEIAYRGSEGRITWPCSVQQCISAHLFLAPKTVNYEKHWYLVAASF